MSLYIFLFFFVIMFFLFSRGKKTTPIKKPNNKQKQVNKPQVGKQPLKTNKVERFSNIKEALNLNDVVFLDTETTGLDKGDQIIEIAILDIDGNILLNSLVNPTVSINRKAQEVHGISKKDVAKAPSWKDIYSDYLACTENKTILAYNSKYDKRMVQQSCKAHGIVNKRRKWDCIMLMYSEFMGNTKNGWYVWHKLTTASFNCGVQIANSDTGAHRALYDTGLSIGVYRYMKKEVDVFFNKEK